MFSDYSLFAIRYFVQRVPNHIPPIKTTRPHLCPTETLLVPRPRCPIPDRARGSSTSGNFSSTCRCIVLPGRSKKAFLYEGGACPGLLRRRAAAGGNS